MKYLKISNYGEIEVEALTLVGASTKRDDQSKIGMFGSGNKYALAYLMRNGYDVLFYSDQQSINVNTVPATLRDCSFNVITINGDKTSITTEMGPQWTLWMAIREFYANAVDEKLISFEIVDHIMTTKGGTDIFIEVKDELHQFMDNINDYIAITKEVVFQDVDQNKILKKHSDLACIYRKGMRCYDTREHSVYDYDFPKININESRIVSSSWNITEKLTSLLFKCSDPVVIRNILEASTNKNYLEYKIDNHSWYFSDHFDYQVWLDAIGNKAIAPMALALFIPADQHKDTFFLRSKMYTHLKENLPGVKLAMHSNMINNVAYIEKVPTALQLDTLKEVEKFFKECQFDMPYPVKIVEFAEKQVHGMAEDGTVYLSVLALDQGKTHTANVIIEEYIHLKHNVADETRAFQKSAIIEFINYMKLINTYNL